MQSEVRELSPVLVEVDVQVPWERVQQDLEQSIKRVAKTARVRGFRPGKVPRGVVKQLFGKQVKGEVTAQLVEQGLWQAVQEHELDIVAQPDVQETPQIEEGQPLTFTAKMEVRPKVEHVDLSNLEVYEPASEVTGEQVNEELERLRGQHAEVRVPEPMRPAREGDQLTIDYTVTVDGEPQDDLGASDRAVELGAGRLLDEFEHGLQETQPGEDTEFDVTFPEDHGREELKGKTARFHVHVKELQEKVLPEIDDEFAKDVGDYETLDELEEKIRGDLEDQSRRKADSELKEKLVDKLIETNAVTVPPSMLEQQKQQLVQEFAQMLQMGGQQMPLSEDLEASMQQRAERRVRAGILLNSVAREEGIEASDEDIEAKLRELAEASGKHIAKVRAEHQGEELEGVKSQILEDKLMDFLRSRAKIKEGPPPEDDRDAAAEGSSPRDATGGETEPTPAETEDQ